MKIIKTAANLSHVPRVGDRNWVAPGDARILRHIYLLNETSPRRKYYTIRVYTFQIEVRLTWCNVVVCYWGGTTPTRTISNQVKFVTISDTPLNFRMVADGYRSQKSDEGYRTVADVVALTTNYSDAYPLTSISMHYPDDDSEIRENNSETTLETKIRNKLVSPKAPERPKSLTKEKEKQEEKPSPKEAEEIMLMSAFERLLNDIQNKQTNIGQFDALISGLQNGQKGFLHLKPDAFYSEPFKSIVQKILNEAILGGDLFFRVLNLSPEILSKIGISDEAQRRVQEYLDVEQSSPRIKRTFASKKHDKKIYVEVADTPIKREYGLMDRKSLSKNSGMLFKFQQKSNLSFWMKSTYIPLDIAFLDDNGKILQIEQMYPLSTKSIRSNQKCKYALEVNRGWFKENSIKEGDFIGNVSISSKELKVVNAQQIPNEQPQNENTIGQENTPNKQPKEQEKAPSAVLDMSIRKKIDYAQKRKVPITIVYTTIEGHTLPPRKLLPIPNEGYLVVSGPNGYSLNAYDASPNMNMGGMEIEGGHIKSYLLDNILSLDIEEKNVKGKK